MHDTDPRSDRTTTGVWGLDAILAGGLLSGSTSILQGPPGSGKTVLANQIAFHLAARGGDVLYVTLLAESHAALLRHLGSLAFYEAAAVGERIVYISGFDALRADTATLLTLLQRELLARRPTLLVVDGIGSVKELHGLAPLRQFLHELQVSTEATGCTCILTGANPSSPNPEEAVVDTVIFMCQQQVGLQAIRELQVNKMRGSAHLAGRHVFAIDHDGLKVFPRFESLYRWPSREVEENPSRIMFDHPPLDEMLGGGVRAGTSTLLLGASGTGKTLLGLSFLAAGVRSGEPAVYAGFSEAPDRLVGSGESIGLELGEYRAQGLLQVDWQAPADLLLDAWGHRLLDLVHQHRPKRLFIDGLNALEAGASYAQRLPAFLTALSNELRAQQVTTVLSVELRHILDQRIDVPLPGVSALVENTILLRYLEHGANWLRTISILKTRASGHQTATREFQITPSGIQIASTSDSVSHILRGHASRQDDVSP